ncbi:MAG: hypothetical protein P4L51_05990 [Puia sp.]|nr:hypothetical protein [Puia sp.]
MEVTRQNHIEGIYRQFRKSIASVEWMIQFWGPFLKYTLEQYLSKQDDRQVFGAIFTAYNIPVSPQEEMWLWKAPDQFSLNTDEMEVYRKQFFHLVMNFGLVRAYQAIEMLLFQAAVIAHFPKNLPEVGKNATKMGDALIKKAFREDINLGHLETKNNRHLLRFHAYHSPDFGRFMQETTRIDQRASWAQFFEMMSIIRSINVHHGGWMTKDVLNELQSIAKGIFQHSFEFSTGTDGLLILQPKEGDPFLYIVTLTKDLAVNALKYIFDLPDLSFLGMRRC